MRHFFLALAAVLLVELGAPLPAGAQGTAPLSRSEILEHLRTRVTPYSQGWEQHEQGVGVLCKMVKSRGVSFRYNESAPSGFDQEMHSAAGGTTGRTSAGESCNLVSLIQTNYRSAAAAPAPAAGTPAPAGKTSPTPASRPATPSSTPSTRPASPTPQTAAGTTSPRMGSYYVMTYGNVSNPIRIGTFELRADGTYQAYLNGGKSAGAGRYNFDRSRGEVRWLSGPYQEFGPSPVTVIRGGRTYQVRLNRTTYGFSDAP